MNDRLADARVARLVREARLPPGSLAVRTSPVLASTPASNVPPSAPPSADGLLTSRLAGVFLAGVFFETIERIGRSIAPTPPLQIRAVRR